MPKMRTITIMMIIWFGWVEFSEIAAACVLNTIWWFRGEKGYAKKRALCATKHKKKRQKRSKTHSIKCSTSENKSTYTRQLMLNTTAQHIRKCVWLLKLFGMCVGRLQSAASEADTHTQQERKRVKWMRECHKRMDLSRERSIEICYSFTLIHLPLVLCAHVNLAQLVSVSFLFCFHCVYYGIHNFEVLLLVINRQQQKQQPIHSSKS